VQGSGGAGAQALRPYITNQTTNNKQQITTNKQQTTINKEC